MRKVIAAAFISLDGVMQAPGGAGEDDDGGFRHGGWSVPHWHEEVGAALGAMFAQPFELLLGRRTYDLFAAHWPRVPLDPSASGYDAGEAQMAARFNAAIKHVASGAPHTLTWQNTRWLGSDIVTAVRRLKRQEGPVLLVQGSSLLLQTLLANRLLDTLLLLVYPVVLGQGKRLFGGGAVPVACRLEESRATSSGVLIARYGLGGEVKTGTFALDAQGPRARRRSGRIAGRLPPTAGTRGMRNLAGCDCLHAGSADINDLRASRRCGAISAGAG